METLQNVFPLVPPQALERVLDICDQSVEAASDWLLENDWNELMDAEGEQEEDDDVEFVGETAAPNQAGADRSDERGAAGELPAFSGGGYASRSSQQGDGAFPPFNSGGYARRTPQSEGSFPLINGGGYARRSIPQAHDGNRPNGHGVVVGAAAATQNYISRGLSGGSTQSPGSSHSDQPHLTMAVSTAATSTHSSNSDYIGSSLTSIRSSADNQHTHHDRLGRPPRRDDVDREYDSAGERDHDSEDGDGEGEEEEDDEDDEDEDDEDDEDGDGNYYDSGDESYYPGSLPQLTKRVKVTRDPKVTNVESNEYFWASFDGQVIPKTLIELLNTTLSKLAHSSVTLLNKSSKHVAEHDAREHLKSILNHAEEAMPQQHVSSSDGRIRSGSILSRILSGASAGAASEEQPQAGQKRKRADESATSAPRGFFAYFFSVNDLDMVWRSILHAHLFNGRFGEVVELHTSASGVFSKRDFDELMHIYTSISSSSRSASLGASSLSGLRCCLLLPCTASEDEIFRVGKHLHTLLKIQGSLYYRTLDVTLDDDATCNRDNSPADLLNEDGKLSEESFRRFARYRIKKEEVDANEKSEKEALGPDHFLAYQQQRKVDHCLQHLEKNAWVQRLSG